MEFHFIKSQFSVKSLFKEWKGTDGGYSLNRDFNVITKSSITLLTPVNMAEHWEDGNGCPVFSRTLSTVWWWRRGKQKRKARNFSPLLSFSHFSSYHDFFFFFREWNGSKRWKIPLEHFLFEAEEDPLVMQIDVDGCPSSSSFSRYER